MGVTYLVCKYCGETYHECSDYIQCDGEHRDWTTWCSEECAKADGYENAQCKKGIELIYNGRATDECEFLDYDGICDRECKNFIPESCKYCRHEDYEDDILLEFALGLLNKSREELVDNYNASKESV